MLQFPIVGDAGNEVVGFEFIKMLGKHFPADIGDRPIQLIVAKGRCNKIAEDTGLPFGGEES